MDSLLPFLYDSFIRDNIPVYPGVLRNGHPFLQFFKPDVHEWALTPNNEKTTFSCSRYHGRRPEVPVLILKDLRYIFVTVEDDVDLSGVWARRARPGLRGKPQGSSRRP